MPFRQAMETQMSGLLAKVFANVKAENKQRGYSLVNLQDKNGGPVWQEFRPTEGFVMPEGKTQQPALPMPSIFDISFEIYSHTKDGGPFMMGFKDFRLMKPEDRAEFGQLYLDLMANKAQIADANEEAEAAAAVSEAPTGEAPKGEIIPPGEPITI